MYFVQLDSLQMSQKGLDICHKQKHQHELIQILKYKKIGPELKNIKDSQNIGKGKN